MLLRISDPQRLLSLGASHVTIFFEARQLRFEMARRTSADRFPPPCSRFALFQTRPEKSLRTLNSLAEFCGTIPIDVPPVFQALPNQPRHLQIGDASANASDQQVRMLEVCLIFKG